MSSGLMHSELLEFKPSALETFDLNCQGVYEKRILIELTLSLLMRIQATQPTSLQMVYLFNQ